MEKGGNVSIECEADKPIRWLDLSFYTSVVAWKANEFNLYTDLAKFNEKSFNVINVQYKIENGFKYKATLHLYNLDSDATGKYVCAYESMTHYNNQEQLERKASIAIYLHVKGEYVKSEHS